MKFPTLLTIVAAIALPSLAHADSPSLSTPLAPPVPVAAAPGPAAGPPAATPIYDYDAGYRAVAAQPTSRGAARKHARKLALSVGVESGGAPLLATVNIPMPVTTAPRAASLFARMRLPYVSPRTLEAFYVPGHGIGLDLQNDDLHCGKVHIHLFDLGVFHDSTPLTVSRVARSWDLVLGLGARYDLRSHLSIVADARFFMPLDLIGVLAKYGDSSHAIASEIARGGQLWGGVSYRW